MPTMIHDQPASSVTTDTALEKMRQVFGFAEFREGQAEVISRLLDGRSVLAVFPTGGGKSLCYQLPALMLDGLTVVVSPLIALMKDQIDFLARAWCSRRPARFQPHARRSPAHVR